MPGATDPRAKSFEPPPLPGTCSNIFLSSAFMSFAALGCCAKTMFPVCASDRSAIVRSVPGQRRREMLWIVGRNVLHGFRNNANSVCPERGRRDQRRRFGFGNPGSRVSICFADSSLSRMSRATAVGQIGAAHSRVTSRSRSAGVSLSGPFRRDRRQTNSTRQSCGSS